MSKQQHCLRFSAKENRENRGRHQILTEDEILLYLKSTVAANDSSSVMENTQRKPSPLRK